MRYTNPIIPGFYPDPSICRVGRDYYLVTSSFEYFPGVPIFHSRDLVHWRQIGHCLTRDSQLPLRKAWSSGGIFAPTIRHHQGLFYMVTTNVSEGGHFHVTAEDPAGPWSEPIHVEGPKFDPSLFWDDDGSVYFTRHDGDAIAQCQIDIRTGKHLSQTRRIWSGSGAKGPEGPHLYKINGRYYLMIAEGGTEYGHLETIARSDSPWGPFEPCPWNPILSHRSLESPIQVTGHGDLVQDTNGNWWMVFLGVRPVGYQPCHHLGRETFLSPVRWTGEGWPVVGDHGKVALEMEGPDLAQHPWEKEPPRDDFDSSQLRLCWNFLKNPNSGDWSLTERPGWLRLNGSAATLDDFASPAFVGRRQQHFDCRVSAMLDFEPRQDNEEAGLCVRMNERHHYELAVTRRGGQRVVIVRRRIGRLQAVEAQTPIDPGPVTLSISAEPSLYRFSYTLPAQEPVQIGEGETRYVSTEVAFGFTGVHLGMYATGTGQRTTVPADFDWFEYAQGR